MWQQTSNYYLLRLLAHLISGETLGYRNKRHKYLPQSPSSVHYDCEQQFHFMWPYKTNIDTVA